MPTHRIQLRGPWEYRWLGTLPDELPFPAAGGVKMPADWQSLFGDRAGRARFSRRFNRPTNLEPHERVLIVLEHPVGRARLQLNDHELDTVSHATESARFDVTGILKPMNELVIDIELNPTRHANPGELWRAVAIEIQG